MLYCAHILTAFEARSGRQEEWLVHESMVLVAAADDASARRRAAEVGEESCRYDDPTLTLNRVPVRQVFLGVRRIVRADADGASRGLASLDGVEASFTEYLVRDRRALRALVRGADAAVVYLRSREPQPAARRSGRRAGARRSGATASRRRARPR